MRVLAVLVSKDNPEDVESTLKSINGLNSEEFGVLIVDSSHSQKIREIVQNNVFDFEIKYLWIPPLGVYDAMNKAIETADDHHYIWFINPGDRLTSLDSYKAFVRQVRESKVQWAYAQAIYVAESEVLSKPFPREGHILHMMGIFNGDSPISHQAIIAQASVLRECGLFDPKYRISSDIDLILKLISSHTKIFSQIILVAIDVTGVSHQKVFSTLFESTLIGYRQGVFTLKEALWFFINRFLTKVLGKLRSFS
jgi:hypothetical protein